MKFLKKSLNELNKVIWPKQKSAFQTLVSVLIILLLVLIFILIVDSILSVIKMNATTFIQSLGTYIENAGSGQWLNDVQGGIQAGWEGFINTITGAEPVEETPTGE